jgi:hypothetical protein
MFTQLRTRGMVFFILAVLITMLACNIGASAPTNVPGVDPTKVALEFQATALSLQMTQAALNSQATAVQPVSPLQPAVEVQATLPLPSTEIPPTQTQVQPTPTEDFEARLKSAKILVYENTDERGIGMWISDALDGMGLKYTQTGSYSGHFMENLNSGIPWDLIIVGAEDKDKISGEFWDVINTRLARDKVALIAEVWYLDQEAGGPVGKILSGCGIRYEKDMPLDDSIYWWVSDDPIFNEPNTVLPLLHYDLYWNNQAGDRIMLGSGGDATLLAGRSAKSSSNGAVLASCYQGRVIIQTFSDHDFHREDIIPLWQNYIYNTLKNHFLANP